MKVIIKSGFILVNDGGLVWTPQGFVNPQTTDISSFRFPSEADAKPLADLLGLRIAPWEESCEMDAEPLKAEHTPMIESTMPPKPPRKA